MLPGYKKKHRQTVGFWGEIIGSVVCWLLTCAHLGLGFVSQVLVTFHRLQHLKAVTVYDFGLRVAGYHENHVARRTILKGLDRMTGWSTMNRQNCQSQLV